MIENFTSETDSFELDGVSSDTLGLFVDILPPIPLAEQKYTDYNTGGDEQGTTPDEVYNNIIYTIRFYTFLNEDYNDVAVKAFCANKSTLKLSRFPDYYFKIRKISLSADDNLGYGKRIDYTLQLTLAPFRYLVDNPMIVLSSAGLIENTHTRYSKPIFMITGEGDISLTVNETVFTVELRRDNPQTIYIDSSRHITYTGNTLITGKTSGRYPLFAVGMNTVEWSGEISEIAYIGNWRDY